MLALCNSLFLNHEIQYNKSSATGARRVQFKELTDCLTQHLQNILAEQADGIVSTELHVDKAVENAVDSPTTATSHSADHNVHDVHPQTPKKSATSGVTSALHALSIDEEEEEEEEDVDLALPSNTTGTTGSSPPDPSFMTPPTKTQKNANSINSIHSIPPIADSNISPIPSPIPSTKTKSRISRDDADKSDPNPVNPLRPQNAQIHHIAEEDRHKIPPQILQETTFETVIDTATDDIDAQDSAQDAVEVLTQVQYQQPTTETVSPMSEHKEPERVHSVDFEDEASAILDTETKSEVIEDPLPSTSDDVTAPSHAPDTDRIGDKDTDSTVTDKAPTATDTASATDIDKESDEKKENVIPQTAEEREMDLKIKKMMECVQLFPKLEEGLDINIKFSDAGDFEENPGYNMFSHYGFQLFHGWVVDPKQEELHSLIGDKSYDETVDYLISDPDKDASEDDIKQLEHNKQIIRKFFEEVFCTMYFALFF